MKPDLICYYCAQSDHPISLAGCPHLKRCDICGGIPASSTLLGTRTLCQDHMEQRRDYGFVSGMLHTGEHEYAGRIREWEERNPAVAR